MAAATVAATPRGMQLALKSIHRWLHFYPPKNKKQMSAFPVCAVSSSGSNGGRNNMNEETLSFFGLYFEKKKKNAAAPTLTPDNFYLSKRSNVENRVGDET